MIYLTNESNNKSKNIIKYMIYEWFIENAKNLYIKSFNVSNYKHLEEILLHLPEIENKIYNVDEFTVTYRIISKVTTKSWQTYLCYYKTYPLDGINEDDVDIDPITWDDISIVFPQEVSVIQYDIVSNSSLNKLYSKLLK